MELTYLLTKLKLEHLAAQMEAVCEQAAQRDLDYQSFLCEALAVEWRGRDQKGVEAAAGALALAQDVGAV